MPRRVADFLDGDDSDDDSFAAARGNEVRSWKRLGSQGAHEVVDDEAARGEQQIQSWQHLSTTNNATDGLTADSADSGSQIQPWGHFSTSSKVSSHASVAVPAANTSSASSSWLNDNGDSHSGPAGAAQRSLLLTARRNRRHRRRSAAIAPGNGAGNNKQRCSCQSPARFLFGTAPDGARWVAGSGNCLLQYMDATLRGIGQVRARKCHAVSLFDF